MLLAARRSFRTNASYCDPRKLLCLAVQDLDLCDAVDCDSKYADLLRRCCDLRTVNEGKRIHAHIATKSRFEGQRFLGNLLIKMYGSCGCVDEARRVFDGLKQPKNVLSWNWMLAAYSQNGHPLDCERLFLEMPDRNVVSWNFVLRSLGQKSDLKQARDVFEKMSERNAVSFTVMFTAYAQRGHIDESRDIFDQMQEKDTVAWNSMLKTYACVGELDQARNIFERMTIKTIVSWTTMIKAYAQQGYLDEAREIFDGLRNPDTVAWNTMIQGYVESGQLQEAKDLFERMTIQDRDAVTCTLMLSAYSQFGLVEEAKLLFDRSPKQDSISWNSMITAYGRSGRIDEAKQMFDAMPDCLKGLASSWNVMISAYACSGRLREAKNLLDAMPVRNEASCNTLLSGYVDNGWIEEARNLFDRLAHHDKPIAVWNSMLGGYSQSGELEKAWSLFQRLAEPNAVSWDAIVSGYAKKGDGEQALHFFRLMDLQGVKPMVITCTNVLDTCSIFDRSSSAAPPSSSSSNSSLGLEVGKLLHRSLRDCKLDSGTVIQNALMNMYGKCGSLINAKSVFDEMPKRNTVSWNIILSAYAQNGRNADVLELFKAMNLEGAEPNRVTLVSVITACSHAGLLFDGLTCFASIKADFSVDLHFDHYKCVVDLLGRSGQLQAAEKFIETMPFQADDGVWTAFLSACNSHGRVDDAAAGNVLSANPETASLYVLLSNIQATAGDPH